VTEAQAPSAVAPAPVIAVASGKGGVGKSTVAVNLALALHAQGLATGLADADLYGPDIPRMLGLRRRAEAANVTLFADRGTGRSRLQVIERHGVQLASAAFLIGERQGLGVQSGVAALLLRRLIADSDWRPDLDYLVVDLPPGTADVQQFVLGLGGRPVYVLVVVTPQAIAHSDVRRLIGYLGSRAAASVGGVENMSGQVCPACGQVTELFPAAPEQDTIWDLVPRLASIPFSATAAADADQGRPVLMTGAVPEQVAAYRQLARELTERIAGSDGGERAQA
jgi:ATP-binding protein involved in chromosome partitioning